MLSSPLRISLGDDLWINNQPTKREHFGSVCVVCGWVGDMGHVGSVCVWVGVLAQICVNRHGDTRLMCARVCVFRCAPLQSSLCVGVLTEIYL